MLLQSLLRPVLTPIMRGIFDPSQSIAAAWSPARLFAQLFTEGTPGFCGGMSVTEAFQNGWLFQDSAGTTPAALEQPVGLVLGQVGGINASQTTSTKRPVLSARVNLLTQTEDFSNAVWKELSGLEKTPNYSLAPDGTMTACRLYAPSADGILYGHDVINNPSFTRSVWIKSNTGSDATVSIGAVNFTVTPAWARFTVTSSGIDYLWNTSVQSGSDVSIWHPQYELGAVATTYQRVTTAADYDSVGFPHYLTFDGTDDCFVTPNIDMTSTDKVTVFIGLENRAITTSTAYADFGRGAYGGFSAMSGVASFGDVGIFKRGSGATGMQYTAVKPAGTQGVFSFALDLAGATPDLQNPVFHWNGANAGIATNTAIGAGVFGNRPLYIGAETGVNYPVNGRMYTLPIIVGRAVEPALIAEVEAAINASMGGIY